MALRASAFHTYGKISVRFAMSFMDFDTFETMEFIKCKTFEIQCMLSDRL